MSAVCKVPLRERKRGTINKQGLELLHHTAASAEQPAQIDASSQAAAGLSVLFPVGGLLLTSTLK